MKTSKRHHIVPRFYLAGFATESEKIQTLNLDTRSTYPGTISDACLENNFYALPVDDQHAADAYEKHLSKHEGKASEALGKVKRGVWPLPLEDREALATWLAYQHVRVKRRRLSFAETYSQTIKLLVGTANPERVRTWIESYEGTALSDEALAWEIADLTQQSGTRIEIPALHHIQLMEKLLPVVLKRIWNSSWILFTFERRSLLTSDTPVYLLPQEYHPEWSGLGLRHAAGWLIPAGRRVALNISYSPAFGDIALPGSTSVASMFNRTAIDSARQFIYYHPEDGHLVEGVTRPMDSTQLAPIGDDLIAAVKNSGFSPDALTSLPQNVGGPGFSLTDLEWPIPGRIAVRPSGL